MAMIVSAVQNQTRNTVSEGHPFAQLQGLTNVVAVRSLNMMNTTVGDSQEDLQVSSLFTYSKRIAKYISANVNI